MAEIQEIPARFLVKEAAEILGMTAGGLRGCILRGKLPAEKSVDGKLYVNAVHVASFHLYGKVLTDGSLTPTRKVALVEYLKTVLA